MTRSHFLADIRTLGKPVAALLILVFLLLLVNISQVHAASSPQTVPPEGGVPNAECLACHAQANEPLILQSGEPLSLRIDVPIFGNSAHGRNSITCVTCHTKITGFPHPDLTITNQHDYRLGYVGVCADCHGEEASATQDSIHGKLLAEGNPYAPTCVDCHDPHKQPMIAELEKADLALVCAQCHNGIYEEYAQSVHGMALINDNNPDVPGCVDCHGVHSMSDPTTVEFRNSSIYLCADCHTNEEKMAKYGLSTNVLSSYVSDFHGTTVTIFEKTEPGQKTNTAVCYDCHGVHNILSVNDPEKGLAVKENMLFACQKCHPDATTNFPSSWLSHYMPDKNQYPLVYYVNLFYKILIPTVLGGMAIFILSDVYRRLRKMIIKPKKRAAALPENEQEKMP